MELFNRKIDRTLSNLINKRSHSPHLFKKRSHFYPHTPKQAIAIINEPLTDIR
ncbi:MAG: hypothetical protein U7127_04870 [Phormidium sp.]